MTQKAEKYIAFYKFGTEWSVACPGPYIHLLVGVGIGVRISVSHPGT